MVVATMAVVTTTMTTTTVAAAAAAVTQQWRPQCHTDGSGQHGHSQQSTKSGSGRQAETAARAVATAVAMTVATTAENCGDGGGVDAAMAEGTDTGNNQLKAAAEGGQRRRWW